MLYDKVRVHASTAKPSAEGTTLYYINKKFIENYPMVLKYTGEPSLYCIASITQWLQNVITINAEAFATKEIATGEAGETFEGKPWCHVFFCSNRQKEEISASIFQSLGLEDGQRAKIYHGIEKWEINIKSRCFEQGWECFYKDNLIHENRSSSAQRDT